ncbi:hypothetical protein CK203_041984 [Vitis vinifera]|uniref:Uncharacterized protein n=1 Tax=Vitis vinifera TaxID=29760 RepID=A0A438I0H0_VITVI|nr:hypothetical protein CK203_041984 [Vitis vinifera]
MIETSRDWSEKLPFALWACRTFFCSSIGATPYSLVYGMETVLPVEIEMGSLRVALEQQISEANWAQARLNQLNLLDERRLRAADHGLIKDPRGKFKPNWSGPSFIRELTPDGAAWLLDLDGNRFSKPTNVDQLKKYHHASSSGNASLTFGLDSIVDMDDWDCTLGLIQLWTWMNRIAHSMMDDLISSDFPTYHTSDAILGHISYSVKICRSSLICMIIPSYKIYLRCKDFHIIISVEYMSDLLYIPWSYSRVIRIDRNYPSSLFSCDSPMDHSFEMTMDSSSRA